MKLFIDRYTNIDFSYLCPVNGISGESLWVSLELEGELNEEAMLLDFGTIKPLVKSYLDLHIDHSLVIPAQNNKIDVSGDTTRVVMDFPAGGQLICQSPVEAFYLIDADSISINALEAHLNKELRALFPKSVSKITITLERDSAYASYFCYTHGLKWHKGNCQRIAHGHRSAITLFKDNEQDASLAEYWASQLNHKFIADNTLPNRHLVIDGIAHTVFEYSASQGQFMLQLPESSVFKMEIETPTTIESMCLFIKQNLDPAYRVKIFEGVNKGACL